MNKKTLLLLSAALLLWALWQRAFGQEVLNRYIQNGLDSNLALKQTSFNISKAQLDLDRARSLFYPQVNLSSQYTVSNGGRNIDLPLGDILNPVYSTLNQLTSSTKFPQLQNQSEQFLPNDFNDTKFEVTMPLYNPSIKLNRQLKEELISNYKADRDIYKRDLVKNIKQAYYQYLQAGKAVAIYTNALSTVNENLRFSEKLVKNNVATKDVVLKAKAQASQIQTSLIDAQQQQKNAAAYFNFLLNKNLDAAVETDSTLFLQSNQQLSPDIDYTYHREELSKLKSTEKVLQKNLQLSQAYKLPTLNAFYNVGFQGFGYKFNDNHFYQLAGLQLNWNIFKGNDNKLKEKQSQVDIDAIKNQYDDVQNQLRLQATTSYNSYIASLQSLRSSADEVQSATEAFRTIDKKYKEGLALQLEWTDARTQMTNAEIQYSLKQLNVLNKAAELERATATYKF